MITTLEHAALIGNELVLLFADGVEIYLPCPLLRKSCPCAVCQGEPDALGRVFQPTVVYGSSAFELTRFEGVGGYAIQLFWADGHSSGIYTYNYLRELTKVLLD
jgi:DUF971 family protein